MNAMQMLSSEAWVERLGWTLVHFLWQGLAIATLVCGRTTELWRAGPARTADTCWPARLWPR